MNTAETELEPPTAPDRSAPKWLLACSIALTVLGVSCVGCVWWGVRTAEVWIAEGIYEGLDDAIEEARVPSGQARAMRADLERVRVAVEEGRFGWSDVERLDGLDEDVQGLAMLGLLQWFGGAVVEESDLTAEERAHAERTLQRVARAVDEGKLRERDLDARVDIEVELDRGEWNDEDVRIVVAKLERLADDLGIPNEPHPIDVAARFGALVEELLRER